MNIYGITDCLAFGHKRNHGFILGGFCLDSKKRVLKYVHIAVSRWPYNLTLIESALRVRRQFLVVAESCSGGMLADRIVERPGASEWFYGSFVTYQAQAKNEMLGINQQFLADNDLVSRATAEAMASRALALTSAHYAMALTGIAGPGTDGSDAKPGELWIAWACKSEEVCAAEGFALTGSRQEFRLTACALALEGLARRIA